MRRRSVARHRKRQQRDISVAVTACSRMWQWRNKARRRNGIASRIKAWRRHVCMAASASMAGGISNKQAIINEKKTMA